MLTFLAHDGTSDGEGVDFRGYAGTQVVICHVTRSALEHLRQDGETEPLEVFAAHLPQIQEIASRKFEPETFDFTSRLVIEVSDIERFAGGAA